MKSYLEQDIKFVKGVGEQRAKLLAKEIDVKTVGDLLNYYPFRHIDRSKFYRISDLQPDGPAVQIRGKFLKFIHEGEGAKRRRVGLFFDGFTRVEVVWFLRGKKTPEYVPGKEYVIFGKPSFFRNNPSFVHPEVEIFNPAAPPQGLRGVYSLTEAMRKKGITSRKIQELIGNALVSPKFEEIEECLPKDVVDRYKLMPLKDALRNIHFPDNHEKLRKAKERFKFEELYYVELQILRYSKERDKKSVGRRMPRVGDYFNKFYREVLPFALTGAQKRVIKEIQADMNTGRQMNRLVQGDVGSGKTMVAFMSILLAIDNGTQTALMAPTEILATQHYESLLPIAEKIGLNIALLTGSTPMSERRRIHESLLGGTLHLLIGTHALIEDNVQFKNLGLAVIDEQHRFGVAQRGKLWHKSEISPHVLIMTATPIPRTLAMTVYGDLEVSVIDELPPGRKPIATYLKYNDNRLSAYSLISAELKKGHQAYFVFPAIYDRESSNLHSIEECIEGVKEAFSEYRVCCVHGKMRPDEKKYQMDLFVNGEASILVATTVIEVGVNVPNASVMLIEDAERFGLSQLHQLRGRVGRGAEQSYCILMTHPNLNSDTAKRLNVMTETTDGFILSEADLRLRGPGDLEGTQQSGIAFNLKMASLATDGQILTIAREAAMNTLELHPQLSDNNSGEKLSATAEMLQRQLNLRFPHDYNWAKIS